MRLDPHDPILKKVNPNTGQSYFDSYMKDILKVGQKKKESGNRYGRVKIFEADNMKWRSKWEYECYVQLKKLEKFDVIQNLETQIPYVFEHNNIRIGKFIADFRFEKNGKLYVADSKSIQTKKHLRVKWQINCMKAFYGLEVIIFLQNHTNVENEVLGL